MKKLDDIKFTKTEVAKHIAANGFSVDNTLQANPLLFHYHLYRNIGEAFYHEKSKLGVVFSIPARVRNQLVCDFAMDTETLILAFEHLDNYPDAQKMLWHYFTGNKEEVEVDTARVLKESPKLRPKILSVLANKIKNGNKSGRFDIQQRDFGNTNWQYAFGAIWIHWILRNDKVDIWIKDEYKWTPGEARTTQCVHKAMVRAEKYGARKFPYKGTIYSIPITDLANLPQQIAQPVLPW